MALEDEAVITTKNKAIDDAHTEKMRLWNRRRIGPQPKAPGKYSSQQFGCFCYQQQCNMSATGYNCWMCAMNKGPSNIQIDRRGSNNYVCGCCVGLCQCAVAFKPEERQMIQIRAVEEKNRTMSHGAVQHTTTSTSTQQQSFSSLLGRSFQDARNIFSAPFDEAMAVATSMTLASHQVSNLKELRKDARREIGGKTMTFRNGTNIEQHRCNKAYDRGYRNGLVDVDLVASTDQESEVQVENPTTTTDHPTVAAAKETDMNNRV